MSRPARRPIVAPRPARRRAAGLLLVAASLALIGCLRAATLTPAASAYPQPSVAPVAWQIDMTHRTPQRIVVDAPGRGATAYWYMVYTVTNDTDQERFFLPEITLHTDDGRNLPANRGVPRTVFETIRQRTKSLNLVPPEDMIGRLLVGVDEGKSGVAVWEEPKAEIGTFDVFFSGLSGEVEAVKNPATGEPLKGADGQNILIRKTKQLTYKVRGDAVRPEEDRAAEVEDKWVMR